MLGGLVGPRTLAHPLGGGERMGPLGEKKFGHGEACATSLSRGGESNAPIEIVRILRYGKMVRDGTSKRLSPFFHAV